MGKYQKLKGAKKEAVDAKHDAAVTEICKVWLVMVAIWSACVGLWLIGYINLSFLNILCAIAACRGLFKTGYFWRDIKF